MSQDHAEIPQLCFVGGQGKSGTTWVQLILDAHPEIACSGEGHPADGLAAPLLQALQSHHEFIDSNNQLFAELPAYQPMTDTQEIALARRAVLDLMLKQRERCTVVADRTPANIEHIQLLDTLFPDARFLHVLRDPRDVAVSLWFHGLRTNPQWVRKQYGTLDGLAAQMVPAWVAAMKSVRVAAQACNNRYLEIRYEDLHEDFNATATRVFEWLGVAADPDTVHGCREASRFERQTGGRAAGDEQPDSHFRKGIVGDWRNQLQPDTIRQIASTHDLGLFGYD